MIKLNLVSPEQKKYLHYEFIYLSLRGVITMILIFTIIVSAMFISARLMLEDHYASLLAQTTLVNQRSFGIDNEITQINESLKNISEIQRGFVKWSNLVIDFTRAVPSGVSISSLSLDKNLQSLSLNGTATTRDNFLKFQENLKKLTYLNEVNNPIINLLLRENLDFQFTAQINLNKLP